MASSLDMSKDAEPLRILIADDHAMIRQGLHVLLESYQDIIIVGEAWNGQEAVAAVERLRPDVVIMDINMPQMDGITATALIKARYPDTIIIGLSVNGHGGYLEAIKKAGASSLITKEEAVERLYAAIQEAMKGVET